MKKNRSMVFFAIIIISVLCIISCFQWHISGKELKQIQKDTDLFQFSNLLIPDNSETPILTISSPGDGIREKWAVLIAAGGGTGYRAHERGDRNDIRKLTNVLLKSGWDEDHLLVLFEGQATTEAIMIDSFSWLRSQGEDEDDLILYFFSGHGYYHIRDDPPIDEPDGRDEYIHPWDPDMAGWNPDVFILDDELSIKFDSLHSKNVVIIFNTCHAGGILDGTSDFAGSGRVVLASCGVDEASYRMDIPFHWIFPYFCIKGLQGNADLNNDNLISAEELFTYTVEPVQFRAYLISLFSSRIPIGGSSQHPELYDGWPSEEDNADELILVDLEAGV